LEIPTLEALREGQLFLVDKPLNWTSFDVVNKLRYTLKRHYDLKKLKVGHAGTLDPLATGLLLIAAGKMTKKIDTLQGLDKVYTGTLVLGGTTPSADLETPVTHKTPCENSTEEINVVAQQFVGEIDQKPPIFSAIKVDGKRAYQHARSGEEREMPTKRVRVTSFAVCEVPHENDDALRSFAFRVACGKGTYIRSLARDLGEALGCGGYLSGLRRESIGQYHCENAHSIEELVAKFS